MIRQPLVVISGAKDSARAVRRRRAAPALRDWLGEARKMVRRRTNNKTVPCQNGFRLRPVHIELMQELANYPSANDFYCYPSESRMAGNLGISDRQIGRLLVDLKTAGLLSTKRRGCGKTSIWTFCIDGIRLGDRTSMSDQDRTSMSDQDRTPMSDKPSERDPLEDEPSESSAAPPTPPPPVPELRAREIALVTAEALRPLSTTERAHPGWRAFDPWIGHLLDNGAEHVDIVLGVIQSLRSLKNLPPSTFGYFTPAIQRAREARTRPLPQVAQPPSDHHELGEPGEFLKEWLGNDVFAAWFGGSKFVDTCGSTVTISVVTAYKKSRIVADFADACVSAFNRVHPPVDRLVVVVEGRP